MPSNPALAAFEEAIADRLAWGQVLITRQGSAFELRHLSDRSAAAENLRLAEVPELRQLAAVNAVGEFRPLKTQPDLVSGWHAWCRDADELGRAIHHLYPGSIADWFAVRKAPAPPVTHFRDYTGRQTGMYRITHRLSDVQASFVIRAGCHVRNCVKRRFWTVEGVDPDSAESKSLIPCLEPCAVLLEFSRKSMRVEQEQGLSVQLQPSEAATAEAALEWLITSGRGLAPAGDFNSPLNPRRVQVVLEKLRKQVDLSRQQSAQE